MTDNDFQLPTPAPSKDASKADYRAWARAMLRAPGAKDVLDPAPYVHQIACILSDLSESSALRRVMLYVPIRGEIDLISLASWCLCRGWEVCVGRGTSRTSPLQPVVIDRTFFEAGAWNRDACEPDAWGMAVPRAHTPVRPDTLAAVIVPGLAFDASGHRLGRGAGVYDRFLATLPPTTRKIGVIPELRLVPSLPTEPHDVRMDAIVTERRMLPTTA